MSDRLTPEQIASTYKGGVKVLRRLEQYGYRIVHEDDLRPTRTTCPHCGGSGRLYDSDEWGEPCGVCRENGYVDE